MDDAIVAMLCLCSMGPVPCEHNKALAKDLVRHFLKLSASDCGRKIYIVLSAPGAKADEWGVCRDAMLIHLIEQYGAASERVLQVRANDIGGMLRGIGELLVLYKGKEKVGVHFFSIDSSSKAVIYENTLEMPQRPLPRHEGFLISA